jgi:transcriptional regulator with XRE-family HTH domain
MPLTSTDVASAVRAELARAGLSGRAMARDLGWTQGFVQRRLSGKDPFRVDELGRIADYLGISVTTLVVEPIRTEPSAAAS